ncbi:unnamed protein product [Mytilus coruscus]|uniref:DUF6570 domain-containing protein n=1 Tax=Mytilus coruscus TaxID=42192 RepID=A0A6J8CDT1_MYTCO|nr:unnamed protein product [Mytilus coruscus]
MGFPHRLKELNLYPLEERLFSLRIPFMQIRQLPRSEQLSVKGNVVNVPVEIQPAINSLPHTLEKSGTIAVKLKKKLALQKCDLCITLFDEINEVDENETHVGNTDTLLDYIPDDNPPCDTGLTFAPGEGQRPISLYSDPDAEYLIYLFQLYFVVKEGQITKRGLFLFTILIFSNGN